jgi:diguanylate cyclase (GGDEF)-like protein
MSLSKQLYLGLTLVLALVFVSTLWINVDNTRSYINSQLASHAQDTATSLGLSIKPFIGNPDDSPMVEGMINAIFDNGYYQSFSLKDNTGALILERNNPMVFDSVPAWFVGLFPLTPPKASTEIYDGWVNPKILQITSHPGFGYEQLWQSAIKSSWMILALFIIAGTLVSFILKTITAPIKKAAEQANAICKGDFVQVSEIPKPIELNLFVNAMNRMSYILQNMFNELTKQTEKYQKVAFIDELTGLANRRAFNNKFEALLLNKEAANSGSIMIIRLSNLDTVNKSIGYLAGDEYINTAVGIINDVLDPLNNYAKNIAYRLAGSDFAITLQDSDKETSQKVAQTLIAKFNQAGNQAELTSQLNSFAHIGITGFSSELKIADVLTKADNALLGALSDKNGWQFATNDAIVQGNTLWKSQLEQLLASDSVTFVAQAIKNKKQELLYHELYARFNHTQDKTPIPMGQLMAVAERLNLADRFDQLVIQKALQQVKQLKSPIALNLSAASLGHQGFCSWLVNELSAYKGICKDLTFEISEQSLIQHADSVCLLSKKLKALGCRITLEHFGASTSSFTHLLAIQPENVKIDGSYSQDIQSSTENQLFVQSLVNIAHSLNINVIAELVENKEQLLQLQSLFVDNFQGYHIEKPQSWQCNVDNKKQ